MRAAQAVPHRLRLLVAAAALALSVPTTAWSTLIMPFTGGWEGFLDQATQQITGEIVLSDLLPLASATAHLDPAGPYITTSTWVGAGGGLIETAHGAGTLAPNVAFVQYAGSFTFTAGSGPTDSTSTDSGSYLADMLTLANGSGQAAPPAQGDMAGMPELAVWFLLAGLGLFGFVRLRRAAQNGI